MGLWLKIPVGTLNVGPGGEYERKQPVNVGGGEGEEGAAVGAIEEGLGVAIGVLVGVAVGVIVVGLVVVTGASVVGEVEGVSVVG